MTWPRLTLFGGFAAVIAVALAGGFTNEPKTQVAASVTPSTPACELAAADLNPADRPVLPSRGVPLIDLNGDLPQLGYNDPSLMTGQLTLAATLRAHRAAASAIWRMPLDWGVVELQPGALDFTEPDRVYCAALDAGVQPLFHLTGIPGWAAPGSTCQTPCVRPPEDQHLPAFTRFAEAAAIRYPRVAAFESWNEPNLAAFWGGRPNPADYLQVAAAIYAGAKNGNPGLPVVAGSTTNNPSDDPATGNLAMTTFLRSFLAAGGARFMDAVAFHAYPFGRLGSEQDLFTPALTDLLETLDGADEGQIRIWLTETGVPTQSGAFAPPMSESDQAEQLAAMFHALAATGRADVFVVHTLLDPGLRVPGGPGFGVLTQPDGSGAMRAKPALCSLRDATDASGDCPRHVGS